MIFTEWQPHLLFCAWLFHRPHRFSVGRKGKFLTRTLHRQISHVVSSSINFAAQTNAELLSDMLEVKLDGDMTQCDVSMPLKPERDEVNRLLNEIGIATERVYIIESIYKLKGKRLAFT